MEPEKPEFFKLDTIDREVLLWIITHAPRSVASWIDYISHEYEKKAVIINPDKLYREVHDSDREI